ncbi:MAG: DUF167 domain-containing protein [Deferribacteraceae bacterium]|jgi:uncharacterized protein YggU (UPF0235/DUF167 family)|nr:DUF167 domain-containing protein [Deferribacteraceae bacterium]
MKITLYIQPGVTKTGFNGEYNGMIRLCVSALPVDDAANQAVIEFIAKTVGLSKSSVKIVSGKKSRIKTVQFDETQAKYQDKIGLFVAI